MNCIGLVFSALKGIQMLFYESVVYGLSWRKIALIFQYNYLILLLIDISYFRFLILLSGDVQLNPGPCNNSFQSFSFLHWNLNSISSNNFAKLSSLMSLNSLHKYDFIGLSETFLNSEILSNNENLVIPGYNIVRNDHPSDTKRGGVCVYYKQSLPLRVLDLNYLEECIIFEVNIENKQCIFMLNYRSPSQTPDEFEDYLTNFQLNIDSVLNLNPFLFCIFGDFNAKSTNWYRNGVTTTEGREIDSMTSQFGLHQIISEPTHIMNNSFSCIDLIFCNQVNLITDFGVLSSLHPNCHHQLVYAKFDLNVYYPPPYERIIWRYNEANADHISRSLELFDWENAFLNCAIDEQVAIFNRTINNVISNFIPHELKTFDDKDPPWITNNIKQLIKEKEIMFNFFLENPLNDLLRQSVNQIQESIIIELENAKQNYYEKLSQKLIYNRKVNPKVYWSLLKTLLSDSKIPCIPPLIIDDEFVIDVNKKAKLFNDFFAKQCSIIENNSSLPSEIYFWTNKTLSKIEFSEEEIYKMIGCLDSNKAHGHDMISIRMLKLCGRSVCKPLKIIFENCLANGYFPDEWKKANVVPIHKKSDKKSIKNYRPVSLLPICSKIFERILYDRIFMFLSENDLISPKQSGFKPSDSCVNQLLSITYDIHKSFDNNLEVRGIFLDISKAFDRVWHQGLLFKLKQNGISGDLFNLLVSFLENRKQRVVLNGQFSPWANVNAGVPQGSILGPLFFLVYINDLCEGLKSNPRLFADDVSLFSAVSDINITANQINSDLTLINEWAFKWKMQFNPDPSKQAQEVLFSRKIKNVCHPNLNFNNDVVNQVPSQKHLGLILDQKLDFNEHLKVTSSKVSRGVGLLRKLHHILPRFSLLTIYKSFIRPHLDYGDVVFDQAFNESFHKKLECLQYSAALAITGAIRGSSREKIYHELGIESLKSRRWFRKLALFYKIYKTKHPPYLYDLIPKRKCIYETRQINNIPLINVRHNYFKNSFFPSSIIEWNNLDIDIRSASSIDIFKKSILKIIRPKANSIFDIHNPLGVKLLTRLRLGLSHLHDHKFKYNFQDCLNPLCICGVDVEDTKHFFLHCNNYNQERQTLFDMIARVKNDFLNLNESELLNLLLYGHLALTFLENREILNASIMFILASKRFDGPLI